MGSDIVVRRPSEDTEKRVSVLDFTAKIEPLHQEQIVKGVRAFTDTK
jgi:hypothetical protein